VKPDKSRLQIAEGIWQIENSELPAFAETPALRKASGGGLRAGRRTNNSELYPVRNNAPLKFLMGFTYETTLLLSHEKIPGKYKSQE